MGSTSKLFAIVSVGDSIPIVGTSFNWNMWVEALRGGPSCTHETRSETARLSELFAV